MKALRLVTIMALAAAPAACKKEKAEAPAEQPAEPTEAETPTEPTEPEAPAAEEPVVYEAPLQAAKDGKVGGTVTFTALDGGKVKVEANITGLTPGEHGFHVHETGDCSAPDFKSAGGHFNPAQAEHGAPDAETHHAGDFGNVTADESGNATASWEVDFISLEEGAESSVVGKAVVVHAKADDLKSQPSGDAGGRIACGVIAKKEGEAAEGEAAEGEAAEGAAEGEAAEGAAEQQ